MFSSKVFVQLYHSRVSSASLSFFLFTSNPPNPFCFLIFICCSAFARRMLQKWGKKTLTEVRSEEKWWFYPYKKQKMQCKKTLTNRWIKCIYTIKLLETSTRVKKNVRWNESNFCVYFVDFVVAFAITYDTFTNKPLLEYHNESHFADAFIATKSLQFPGYSLFIQFSWFYAIYVCSLVGIFVWCASCTLHR